LVELAGRLEIPPERLFNHDPGPPRAAGFLQSLGHRGEKAGRDREIMGGMLRVSESAPERRERGGISVIAAHVLQPGGKFFEGGGIQMAALHQALVQAFPELIDAQASLATPITGISSS